MYSILKVSNLGYALMIFSPISALGFGGWEAFFPVTLTSVLGSTICLIVNSMSTHMFVGQLTAELVHDLVSADKDRRDLVLAELNEIERDWFLAELRRRQWRNHSDCCTGVRCGWGLRLLNMMAV